MDGPAFSTRAESEVNRQLGFDVIGMTNLGEAKLAREAEIALATMAMITDYDCWKTDEAAVTADSVFAHLKANAAAARQILAAVIPRIPREPDWPEHRALDAALITPQISGPRSRRRGWGRSSSVLSQRERKRLFPSPAVRASFALTFPMKLRFFRRRLRHPARPRPSPER